MNMVLWAVDNPGNAKYFLIQPCDHHGYTLDDFPPFWVDPKLFDRMGFVIKYVADTPARKNNKNELPVLDIQTQTEIQVPRKDGWDSVTHE